ncbi:FadR/GntR family transcriptional regulator [Microvirga lotononidis]|uniref:Transcriptional regulator n=1 Tax=Microvirga lotononidis TaxID=864069 RepID=I4Z4C3_9HYPH|nr:FadR/GntR family transcriptional regulator [Microvirga lotononidis]EIM31065.1 transcriptional regulator [Microvirga lotononidis]WQO30530.1 FadR/GntR family transcriptional regulator [Microvirga lotononidis]
MTRLSSFKSLHHRDGTLTRRVTDTLREGILAGNPPPGDKLPSEARLIETFNVSRTVIREALSTLREEGLVEPRQGAGVFVLGPEEAAGPALQGIDPERISSVVEGLELRTAIEVEAAYLAATRCSPLQEETIIQRHYEVGECIKAGRSTIEADFALHLAIVEASNNRRFVDLLKMLGHEMIPRSVFDKGEDTTPVPYLERLHEEHRRIVSAISNRDNIGAREAMRDHLAGSQKRYRALLNDRGRGL